MTRASTHRIEVPHHQGWRTNHKNHLSHHDASISGASSDMDAENGPLSLLKTRWTVRGFPFKPLPEDGKSPQEGSVEPVPKHEPRTDVSLSIEYKFANIAYDVLSRGVASGLAYNPCLETLCVALGCSLAP